MFWWIQMFLVTLRLISAFEQKTCIGNNVSIRCPTFEYLPVIEEAVYGALDGTCANVENVCEDKTAISRVISKCHGLPRCSFTLKHNEFSGVCENSEANALYVTYSCVLESSIQDICAIGQDSLNSDGYLKSPGFPGSYGAGLDCELAISPEPGILLDIKLTVLDWDFEDGCGDTLEMMDGTSLSTFQFCGTFFATRERTFDFQDVKISLKTKNQQFRRRGFLLYYTIQERPDDEVEVVTVDFSGDESEITDMDEGFFTTRYISTPKATVPTTETYETTTQIAPPTTMSTTTIASGWGRHTRASTLSTTTRKATTTTMVTPPLMENSTTTATVTPPLMENSTVTENDLPTLSTTVQPTSPSQSGLESIEVCTGDTLSLSCPVDHFIVIKSAMYGYGDQPQCGVVTVPAIPCSSETAMHKVARACSGRKTCDMTIGLNIAIGECSNEMSSLRVNYICEHVDLSVNICSDKEIRPDKGYIRSHKYPNAYGKGRNCERDITPPAGYEMHIQLLDIELEARRVTGCYDFLYVINPKNPSETKQYCGDLTRYKLEERDLTLEQVELQFVSDPSKNNLKGFLLYFEAVPIQSSSTTTTMATTQLKTSTIETSTLSTTLIAESTTVPLDESRTWIENGVTFKDVCKDAFISISSPSEESIIIQSASFGARSTTECQDISRSTCPERDVTPNLTALCTGRDSCSFQVTDKNVPIHCQSGSLLVAYKFVSVDTIKYVCAGSLMLPSEGYLTSPRYPDAYKANSICEHTLSLVIPDTFITVTILDLDMHKRLAPSSGCYDNVILSEPDNFNIYFKYCGDMDSTDSPLSFNASSLEIEYRADAYNSGHRGFMFHYKVIGTNESDAALMMTEITTPQPSTISTTTTTTTTPTTTSQLISTISTTVATTTVPPPSLFPSYQVLITAKCQEEVVELECSESSEVIAIENAIYHISPGSCDTPLGSFSVCRDDVTVEVSDRCSGFETCTFQLKVLFSESNCYSSSSALTVKYMCVPAPIDMCQPGKLARPEGFIASPSYPSPYPRSQNCNFDIQPRGENATVQIRFYDLQIYARPTSGCYESLTIREKNSPFHIYTLCGTLSDPSTYLPQDFRYEHLQLDFISHGRILPHKGFLLYYKFENEEELPETTVNIETTLVETTTLVVTSDSATTNSVVDIMTSEKASETASSTPMKMISTVADFVTSTIETSTLAADITSTVKTSTFPTEMPSTVKMDFMTSAIETSTVAADITSTVKTSTFPTEMPSTVKTDFMTSAVETSTVAADIISTVTTSSLATEMTSTVKTSTIAEYMTSTLKTSTGDADKTSTVKAETPKVTTKQMTSTTAAVTSVTDKSTRGTTSRHQDVTTPDTNLKETTTSEIDEGTTTGPIIGGKAKSTGSGGKKGTDGGLIAGIVLALLFLIALIICGVLFLRYRRRRNTPVQKPGRHDLWANTTSPTQDAMNEYTYVNMNGHDATFDENSKPLHAHESALSTPLYDDNKNRTFSQAAPEVGVVTVNGVNPHENAHQNGTTPSTKYDGTEGETSFGASGPAAYAFDNPAVDSQQEYSDTPSVSETESQDTVIQAAVANIVDPPKDFGESSTDGVSNDQVEEGSGTVNVSKDPNSKLRRDKTSDNRDDLKLTPNPYESQSVA